MLLVKDMNANCSEKRLFVNKTNFKIILILLSITLIFLGINRIFHPQKAEGYYRIVVLSDAHLPVKSFNIKNIDKSDKIIAAKNKVLEDINSWQDVGAVAVLGDVVGDTGTDKEYAYAESYFSKLHKPKFFVVGNHDYIYQNNTSANGSYIKGDTDSRRLQLSKFKKTFALYELYYAKKVEGYLLIFLSVDSLDSSYLTQLSSEQLSWFKETLKSNPKVPTIVFFHAPLKGTLSNYNNTANKPNFIAQPEGEIDEIINNNKQIVLWVSGHTHTPATNASFASDINLYRGRVLNVHNADMDRETIWTNSLFLYPNKIVIRTFNHSTEKWMNNLERTIAIDIS